MTFKQEFLSALKGGQDCMALLDLARGLQGEGLPPEQIYETLQEIWREFGFDKRQDGGVLQNNLEAVMEKVWYECPA
jgi:hypothetical protein